MTIENKLQEIIEAFQMLIEANNSYLSSVNRAVIDSFRNLVDQRALIGEDIELLTRQLVQLTEKTFKGNTFPCQNMVEAIRALPVVIPALSPQCERVKDTLKELVESDKVVEAAIATMRDDLKIEIAKIRKGSQGIKGYRHVETLGSCFINKVK